MVNILNLDGTLNEQAGPYRGQTVLEARKNVVADLEKLGLVVKVEDRQIDLAHSDRSKTPIEPLVTDQWFVKMEQLAQTAIDAVLGGEVRIIVATPRASRLAQGEPRLADSRSFRRDTKFRSGTAENKRAWAIKRKATPSSTTWRLRGSTTRRRSAIASLCAQRRPLPGRGRPL